MDQSILNEKTHHIPTLVAGHIGIRSKTLENESFNSSKPYLI